MNLTKTLSVRPGKECCLADYNPASTAGFKSKSAARSLLDHNLKRLTELQYLLYAEGKRSVLIILQGMDAAGKDGTVRHVMGALNPQSCRVVAFKQPTPEEIKHDFLWRIHKSAPAAGEIVIFNRSHYEDVLIVRVDDLIPESIWKKRYDRINDFENLLVENGVIILKFFLHVSKAEQKKRLLRRLRDPARQWKLNPEDFKERKHWEDYVRAYEDALTRCSTKHAPWFIIPADNKWFRNLAVSQIIVDALIDAKMKMPKPAFDLSKIKTR